MVIVGLLSMNSCPLDTSRALSWLGPSALPGPALKPLQVSLLTSTAAGLSDRRFSFAYGPYKLSFFQSTFTLQRDYNYHKMESFYHFTGADIFIYALSNMLFQNPTYFKYPDIDMGDRKFLKNGYQISNVIRQQPLMTSYSIRRYEKGCHSCYCKKK